jgi:hypothetical protein
MLITPSFTSTCSTSKSSREEADGADVVPACAREVSLTDSSGQAAAHIRGPRSCRTARINLESEELVVTAYRPNAITNREGGEP